MNRWIGLVKVNVVLALNYVFLYAMFEDYILATAATGVIWLWTMFGGYLTLWKEGAVRSDKLPAYEQACLDAAKAQLVRDVQEASGVDVSGLKLYLIPGDHDMQATAYGANCVSVARGTLEHTDPLTLNAVLAHEVSHILRYDSETNRAVFAFVFVLCGVLSMMSFAFVAVVFLAFLIASCFSSWIGVMAFRGTRNLVSGLFELVQKGVVLLYRVLDGIRRRSAEYRCDAFAASLGYGLQLAHFLSYAAPESGRQLTLNEALYRSHPPTPQRIARLEAYVNSETQLAHR